jgi:hypothetical protein
MENRDEAAVKRVERLARQLTYATVVLGIVVVLLLILDFAPS